ncbi:tRNA (adenosine(37)-N6)-threonylcarbamoyltransferase complex ATPase subunit type 1 TsaE [Leptolyngbya sp. FACHB-261]|uniref:tRNA (adenosine(37)-N6)-threonylcarbamoyltransferase complex ATPase subunit type 1 TsaE n=1 Tax=Leptolyngbya sp. FACHB-261 TaxID=2692806 RepID=UPI00168904E5|nr:tRNA (adenosine(37)-N6)-threonylcarbamoyltransferase complex ATPase subunit type 1 TsaE [Leptolyngbya sp. FACHB-261]MBD2105092.1 tRNA (adenosine(37)-N6)-threonylcarbamoyltransferase complex ATPase subunit type 1 TsaE [Leptolyngbya sp. FACHB-261]
MVTLELSLPSAEATLTLGQFLGRTLEAGSVLLLNSGLGGGKTTLVQGIGQGLAIPELVLSPTFTLIEEYLDGRLPLYHMDLYRLEPREVEDLHLEDYWEAQQVEPGIVAVEWAERLVAPPPATLDFRWLEVDETQRRVLVSTKTPTLQTILDTLQTELPEFCSGFASEVL